MLNDKTNPNDIHANSVTAPTGDFTNINNSLNNIVNTLNNKVTSNGDYLRFDNGIQICYGWVCHSDGGYDWSEYATFAAPFSYNTISIIATPVMSQNNGAMATTADVSVNGCTINQQSKAYGGGKSYYVNYVAFGRWK